MTNDNATPTAAWVSAVEAGLMIAVDFTKNNVFKDTAEYAHEAFAAYRAHVDERERLLLAFVERVNEYASNRDKQFHEAALHGDIEHIERSRTAYIYTLSRLGDEARALLALLAGGAPPADTSAGSEAT